MYKCAKCNDFLDGHKCNTCMLMHRCIIETCKCQQFPNLPVALGKPTQQIYDNNSNPKNKLDLRKDKYRTRNIYTSSVRSHYNRTATELTIKRLDYKIMARIESESEIHDKHE